MRLSDLFLRFLANEGLHRKVRPYHDSKTVVEQYVPRMRMELDVFRQVEIADYFLILGGIVDWCRSQDIPTGVGRGSAAGCLVSYLTNITMLDPLEHGLMFERFYNAGRMETKELPDIDLDVAKEHRERVIREYIIPTYGEEYVAPICTFGALQSKAAVNDVGRVLRVPPDDVKVLTGLLKTHRGINETMAHVLEDVDEEGKPTPRALKAQQMARLYPELFKWLPVIEEIQPIRTEGVHAAGIIICPKPVGEVVPLRWNPRAKLAVTGFDMYELASTGVLKLDLLGLRTLDVIQHSMRRAGLQESFHDFAERLIRKPTDPDVYTLLSKGLAVGVFQFESPFMRRILKDVKPENLNDLSAINALGRPGPLDAQIEVEADIIHNANGDVPPYVKGLIGNKPKPSLNMIEVYVARKKGELKVHYLHPDLEPILKSTYGVIVFQEQVMMIATDLAGYTPSEADNLRSIMGKKKVDKMPAQEEKFLNGCVAHGLEMSVAKELWEQIQTFAEYGFNRCVAAGNHVYSKRGYLPIEQIVPGDYVLSTRSGMDSVNTTPMWRKVVQVYDNGPKPCISITTMRGFKHVVTADHGMMGDAGVVRAGQLKAGEFLPTIAVYPELVSECSERDVIRAALLGMLFASRVPHFSAMTGPYEEVQFAHKKKELAELVLVLAKQLGYEIMSRTEKTMTIRPVKVSHTYRAVFRIPREECDFYKGFLNLPKYEFKLDPESMTNGQLAALIAYFCSCNTVFSHSVRLQLTVSSPYLRDALLRAFTRLGIVVTLKALNVTTDGKLYTMHRLVSSGARTHANIKKFIVPYLVGDERELALKNLDSANRRFIWREQRPYFWRDTITKVEDAGTLHTYDLEVESDNEWGHCYICEGVLTHNSHSASYAATAYLTAYLKTHHPAAFMASLISSAENKEQSQAWIMDARDRMGLCVLPPDVQTSDKDFISRGRDIVFGFNQISDFGNVAANAVLKARGKKEFTSLRDFYMRIDLHAVNASRMRALILAGALDSIHFNRTELLEWDRIIRERRSKVHGKAGRRQENVAEIETLLKDLEHNARLIHLYEENGDGSLTQVHVQGKQKEDGTPVFSAKVTKAEAQKLAKGKLTHFDIQKKHFVKLLETLRKNRQELAEFGDVDLMADLPSFSPMNIRQKIAAEQEVLGLPLSGTIASPWAAEIRRFSELSTADIKTDEFGGAGFFTLCGILTDSRIHTVRQGASAGKQMMFARFCDLAGDMEIVFFNKTYEQYKELLVEEQPLIIDVRLNNTRESLIGWKVTKPSP